MKKLILPILIILIIIFGLWYLKESKNTPLPQDSTISTYKNPSLGITFSYPKILVASTTGTEVTLHHQVPFVHHDYCDFKGEGDTTVNFLVDFHVKFHTVNKNLIDTMKTESPYIPKENFVNDTVIPSPGFIDPYEVGDLKGFQIFEGAEGCGHTIYYFKISDNKNLVVTNDLITVFTGSIDIENMEKAESVPGVLNKEKAEVIFNTVLQSLKVN